MIHRLVPSLLSAVLLLSCVTLAPHAETPRLEMPDDWSGDFVELLVPFASGSIQGLGRVLDHVTRTGRSPTPAELDAMLGGAQMDARAEFERIKKHVDHNKGSKAFANFLAMVTLFRDTSKRENWDPFIDGVPEGSLSGYTADVLAAYKGTKEKLADAEKIRKYASKLYGLIVAAGIKPDEHLRDLVKEHYPRYLDRRGLDGPVIREYAGGWVVHDTLVYHSADATRTPLIDLASAIDMKNYDAVPAADPMRLAVEINDAVLRWQNGQRTFHDAAQLADLMDALAADGLDFQLQPPTVDYLESTARDLRLRYPDGASNTKPALRSDGVFKLTPDVGFAGRTVIELSNAVSRIAAIVVPPRSWRTHPDDRGATSGVSGLEVRYTADGRFQLAHAVTGADEYVRADTPSLGSPVEPAGAFVDLPLTDLTDFGHPKKTEGGDAALLWLDLSPMIAHVGPGRPLRVELAFAWLNSPVQQGAKADRAAGLRWVYDFDDRLIPLNPAAFPHITYTIYRAGSDRNYRAVAGPMRPGTALTVEAHTPSFLGLRYVDSEVEPGAAYRYRTFIDWDPAEIPLWVQPEEER